jgi:hypothetical protein
MNTVSRRAIAIASGALLLGLASAHAQPVCSSDGQAPPTGLLERFINADCEGCWTDTRVPRPARGEVALDWIVPGSRGDDAPLSAAARAEGVDRLGALGQPVPRHDTASRQPRQGPAVRLRVAQGQPFNGYLGASIELPGAGPGPWHAWLALVETLPAGSERTPVARNLVRNVLEVTWDARGPANGGMLREARSMNIPEGARPERLRLIGWVADARGRIRGIAQSRCTPARRDR